MRWTVILGGNLAALEHLAKRAELFSEFGATISMRKPSDVLQVVAGVPLSDGGELYCLTSLRLDALHDGSAVALQASEWLDKWNGSARLVAGIVDPVSVQQVIHRDDHGRQTATIGLSLSVLPAETPESKEAVKQLLQLCTDPVVNRVVSLCGKGRIDWVNAYRIFEVIENACGGIEGIAAKDWASKADIRRFKHTANHPEAIGDHARHGVLKSDPPAKPMSAEEASALMTKIVDSFLKAKMLPSEAGNCAFSSTPEVG